MPVSEQETKEFSTWDATRRLSRFAKPYWPRIALAFVFVVAQTGTALIKPWPLKFIIDSVITKDSLSGTTLYILIGISGLVVIASMLDGLLSYWETYHINKADRFIVFDLRAALFEHVQRLSLQYHSRKRTGDLITRVTTDVKALSDLFTDTLVSTLYAVLLLFGMAVLLLVLDWQLALITLTVSPVFYFFALRYTAKIKQLSRAERRREGALSSVLHESLGAIRLTRVFNQEETARAKFEEENRGTVDMQFETSIAGARFGWVVGVLQAGVTAIVMGFGVQRVMSGSMTTGGLLVFYYYVRGFYKPLQSTMKQLASVTGAAARAERVVDILEMDQGVVDLPGAKQAPPFEGKLEFSDVSFEYEAGQPVLQNINLKLDSRQTIALVGATGAGKTTLASLIPRLYDPAQGAVLIDGVDIRDYTLHSLRSQISMVLQESVLFRSSVSENIAYGKPTATVEDIVAAAKDANAHEFIVELPDGYDTIIGERGDTLSGGQRQRIAIARAMVRNAPILILDEPLVGLDAHSSAAVMEALDRLMAGKTVIVITHDLSTVQRADYVALLERGRIVQQGPVAELAVVEGPYRELLKAQFRDFAHTSDVLTVRP